VPRPPGLVLPVLRALLRHGVGQRHGTRRRVTRPPRREVEIGGRFEDPTKFGALLPWPQRFGAFDPHNHQILFGAPSGWPLWHKLLVVHEIAHVTSGEEMKHGKIWAGEFLRLCHVYLPGMYEELRVALDKRGILYSAPS